MARPRQNPALPQVASQQVKDLSDIQRVSDKIVSVLKAVVEFLEPYVNPGDWKKPEYVTGWVDFPTSPFSGFRYRKDPMGYVHFRGMAQRSSGASTNIAQMPSGYRPLNTEIFTTSCSDTYCRLDVNSTGVVAVAATAGSLANYVSLSGITYKAEL